MSDDKREGEPTRDQIALVAFRQMPLNPSAGIFEAGALVDACYAYADAFMQKRAREEGKK